MLVATLLMMVSTAAEPSLRVPRGRDGLLDGRCERSEWQEAAVVAIAPGMELRAKRSRGHLWFCVSAPADSHNTLDLYLGTASDARLLNLHASAQVGQRVHGAQGWGDYTWWNHQGWYSPAVPFTGMSGDGEKRRPDFMTGRDREVQIDLSQFGKAPWRVLFVAGGTRNAAGEWVPARWPPAGDDSRPETWAVLTF